MLVLGNVAATRDWGYAPDFVAGTRLALRAEQPQDVVVATGVAHSVEEFLHEAFRAAGLQDPARWVRNDPALHRPARPGDGPNSSCCPPTSRLPGHW